MTSASSRTGRDQRQLLRRSDGKQYVFGTDDLWMHDGVTDIHL
jgi:hypothetical protein